jgi:hypothetical protein
VSATRTGGAHLLYFVLEDLHDQSSVGQLIQLHPLVDLVARGCIIVVARLLPRSKQCSDGLDTGLLGSLPRGSTG